MGFASLQKIMKNSNFTVSAYRWTGSAWSSFQCIVSKIDTSAPTYDELGRQDEASFTLDFPVSASYTPQVNDRIKYDSIQYKVSQIEKDSAVQYWKIHLQRITKPL